MSARSQTVIKRENIILAMRRASEVVPQVETTFTLGCAREFVEKFSKAKTELFQNNFVAIYFEMVERGEKEIAENCTLCFAVSELLLQTEANGVRMAKEAWECYRAMFVMLDLFDEYLAIEEEEEETEIKIAHFSNLSV